jgi:mono/diheme cytochrome c family protein
MKKLIALSVFCIVIAAACHKKAVPTATTTTPTDVAVAPADHAAMVEAGKAIYTTKCAKCHPAKTVENYDTTKWAGILKAMIPKAKLDSVESAQVTAYVNENAKK